MQVNTLQVQENSTWVDVEVLSETFKYLNTIQSTNEDNTVVLTLSDIQQLLWVSTSCCKRHRELKTIKEKMISILGVLYPPDKYPDYIKQHKNNIRLVHAE